MNRLQSHENGPNSLLFKQVLNIFSTCFQQLDIFFEQRQDHYLIWLFIRFEHVLNIVFIGF
jgi:hypothetical protein